MEINIQHIAYELFRQWTKNAAFDYPELDFTIIDESALVTDLEDALESALNSLVKTEKEEKRSLPDYDYGFVIGFVQGKINTYWGFEYITKRSKEFKSFMINKALLEYLQLDTLTAIRVKTVYEKMYQDSVNLESLEYELPQKRIEDYNIAQIHDDSFLHEKDNPIIISLKNQVSEQLFNLTKIKIADYLPDIDDFFSYTYVRELIHQKENKKN
jgi:hypothetical protein